MRGEQRSRDGGRGHGINGIECPSKGAVQLERQQQQQRGHVDLGAGIRETQDGILGLVISENTFPFPSFNVCELLNTNILNIKKIRFLSCIYIYKIQVQANRHHRVENDEDFVEKNYRGDDKQFESGTRVRVHGA